MARPKFPHFTLEEARTLELFQASRILVGKWSYDVRLRSKRAAKCPYKEEWLRRMWEAVTAKRIDAVCERDSDINIIEVKRYMLPAGIGQLLVYSYMYAEQFKPNKPIKLWYVTYYNDPDVEEICKRLGIKTWSVERVG